MNRNRIGPEWAYFLGLLWADGSISGGQISIKMIKKDLSSVFPKIQHITNWKSYSRKAMNRKEQLVIYSYDKELWEFLEKNDYASKSDSPDKILSSIPLEFHKFWWRGYFDGDGCFYVNKEKRKWGMSFSGPYEQDWHFLEQISSRLNLSFKIHKRKTNKPNGKEHKSSAASVSKIEEIKRLAEFILGCHVSEIIGFSRKADKYRLFLSLSLPRKTSKYPCVSKNGDLWRASKKINGKTKNLGTFRSEEDAHLAILEYEKSLLISQNLF